MLRWWQWRGGTGQQHALLGLGWAGLVGWSWDVAAAAGRGGGKERKNKCVESLYWFRDDKKKQKLRRKPLPFNWQTKMK